MSLRLGLRICGQVEGWPRPKAEGVEASQLRAEAACRLRAEWSRLAPGAGFQTLTADPPWPFKDSLPGAKRGASKHYQLMAMERIKTYPLPPLAPDARLFLWRVASMPDEALEVCRAWGFTPKAEMVWIKTTKNGKIQMGMGHQTRGGHETCIIATRGRPARLNANTLSWFIGQMTYGSDGKPIHSAKPSKFFSIVERLSPGPICELFARRSRPGWICIGDQLRENTYEPALAPIA